MTFNYFVGFYFESLGGSYSNEYASIIDKKPFREEYSSRLLSLGHTLGNAILGHTSFLVCFSDTYS